jgi:hypothetical protein
MASCSVSHEKVWIMYLEEYIVELGQARQWKSTKPSVKIGDLVLLVKKDVAQGHWQLAVMKEVNPSGNEHVRTVAVKSKAGKYKKPITKLTPWNLIILMINLQAQFCKL